VGALSVWYIRVDGFVYQDVYCVGYHSSPFPRYQREGSGYLAEHSKAHRPAPDTYIGIDVNANIGDEGSVSVSRNGNKIFPVLSVTPDGVLGFIR
jgi:hypothetical protein